MGTALEKKIHQNDATGTSQIDGCGVDVVLYAPSKSQIRELGKYLGNIINRAAIAFIIICRCSAKQNNIEVILSRMVPLPDKKLIQIKWQHK